eukprot:8704684-Pyramimonas_sp.AAC.1
MSHCFCKLLLRKCVVRALWWQAGWETESSSNFDALRLLEGELRPCRARWDHGGLGLDAWVAVVSRDVVVGAKLSDGR